MSSKLKACVATIVLALVPSHSSLVAAEAAGGFSPELAAKVSQLDEQASGELGVYLKRLSDDAEFKYNSDRAWYLASTTKVPVAIAILQKHDAGELSLDRKLTLAREDFVDGAGELLSRKPGESFTVERLLELMLTRSDSTATDMLIEMIGGKELNERVRKMVPSGFGPITPILEVRYGAYSEVHPKAGGLTNMDFVALKRHRDLGDRYNALLGLMDLPPREAKVSTIEQAFEKYYAKRENSGTLEAYGLLLERLLSGKLLSAGNTQRLLGWMQEMKTGEKRIKAGLAADLRFAQKTGTQIKRICNMGIVRRDESGEDALVVAACVERYDERKDAEKLLARIGRVISKELSPDPVLLTKSAGASEK